MKLRPQLALISIATMTTSTRAAGAAAADNSCLLAPEVLRRYQVLSNTQVSPDSNLLEIGFTGRDYLGWKRDVPTCVAVSYNETTEGNNEVLKKSYSPISHPNTPDKFQLLVKAYAPRPGGGVGAYLCGLQPGDSIGAKVKSERIMHGSSSVLNRGWNHVGLVAGGTGIAPLYQLVQILMSSKDESTKIYVLSINYTEQDILLKSELDELAQKYPDRVKVTHSLTISQEQADSEDHYEYGRGSVDMVRKALPTPGDDVMIFVCGRDGFVETWGGPVGRAPPLADGSKGPKIQGPLLGLLNDAGYTASQVFKY
jgi:cytochrome-b5 reductase